MTTRKHPPEHPEDEYKSPIEARLEARIAQQQAASDAANREKLEAELADARQRYLRLAADFENFKKRARQDQLDTIQHASADLISRLLPVLDDLRSALEHKPEGVDEAWAKGIELSLRKLEEVMSTHGLEPIVTELRRGYRIRDRVVRPSLVKVSRRPELPSAGAATPSS